MKAFPKKKLLSWDLEDIGQLGRRRVGSESVLEEGNRMGGAPETGKFDAFDKWEEGSVGGAELWLDRVKDR